MLEQLMDLDSGFLMYIQEFMRNDAATRIFRGITTLGNAGAVWIAISLLLLVPKKTRRIGCMGLLSLVLSLPAAILAGIVVGLVAAYFSEAADA